ncbi:MAG: cell wall metabolism sensor histidine kinase WalK [bacterium]|nr:cell wall metabolism sensor histidine kinase WalK [bacterium]
MKKISKISLLSMNNQSRIIIIFWVLSSLFIFFMAFIAIDKTQQKITESYNNFALMLTKTLASESVILTGDFPKEEQNARLKIYTDELLKDNQDIEFINYKDKNADVYFSAGEKSDKSPKNSFLIDVPMYKDNAPAGSVEVGFTGKSISTVSKAARASILTIFSIMWVLSLLAVLINTLIVTRQISLLSYGVRKISSGEFGYKLKGKELWGEIKLLFDEFNNMSTKLRQYEEKNIDELTYEKNKLESVLMSIANGVIVCDSADNVILLNNAGADMLKVSIDEFIGADINTYSDTEGALPFVEHIKEFKESPLEEMQKTPLAYQTNIDNKVYKVLMSPIFTASQEYLGYIVVLHDVTKEAEIDKLKSGFISNVSHELRTPVTVLRSYIDTLCNFNSDFDEATKQEFLQIMDQEAKRLNNMVNEILDFSRLDAENVKIERGFMDVRPIIENTVNSMKLLAQEKNIVFNVSVAEDIPNLYINQDSIERVLKNLLSNALKYSNNDSNINISAYLDDNKENFVCTVEDFGIGIPKEHLPKLFDRFYRVENKAHTVKGTGLGLHLVKVAIEKHHGGKVFAESEEGKGSKFGFMIPLISEQNKTGLESPAIENVDRL